MSTLSHSASDQPDQPAEKPPACHRRVGANGLYSVSSSTRAIVPFPATHSLSAPMISSLTFLGTGSAIPTPRRSTSSMAVSLTNGSVVLLDCGEATQLQLHRVGMKPTRIDAILITHLHGDHFFGLFGLLSTIKACGRTEPIVIVGPPQLRHVMDTVFGSSGGMEMPLHFVAIEEGMAHDVGFVAGLHVRAAPLLHTIPSFAYVLEEQQRAGTMQADRARALGVTGPQMRRLKEGFTVTTPTGEVRPEHCVVPHSPPFRMALVQDCYDCSAAYDVLRGVDVLIHESTFDASKRRKATEYGHCTATQAAHTARHVDAKALILTHLSTRYAAGQKNRVEIAALNQSVPASPAPGAMEEEKADASDDSSQSDGEVQKQRKSKAGAPSLTADDLVSEAVTEYTDGQPDAHCIPIWAAEDYLVFRRSGRTIRLSEFAAVFHSSAPVKRPALSLRSLAAAG